MEDKSDQVKYVFPGLIILEPISIINVSFSLKGKEIEIVPTRLRVFFLFLLDKDLPCLCVQCWAKFKIEFHSHKVLELRLNSKEIQQYTDDIYTCTHIYCEGTAASPLLSVPPRPLNHHPSPGLGNNKDWRRMMRHT